MLNKIIGHLCAGNGGSPAQGDLHAGGRRGSACRACDLAWLGQCWALTPAVNDCALIRVRALTEAATSTSAKQQALQGLYGACGTAQALLPRAWGSALLRACCNAVHITSALCRDLHVRCKIVLVSSSVNEVAMLPVLVLIIVDGSVLLRLISTTFEMFETHCHFYMQLTDLYLEIQILLSMWWCHSICLAML